MMALRFQRDGENLPSPRVTLDATASWAQKLGVADFLGFQSRANSGFLTQQDINAIGQVSSVAPQFDSTGRVTNAIPFWSDAVTRAEAGESGGGFLSGITDFFRNIGTVALATAGFGIGGLSGASAATGNGVTKDTLALDAAGLAAGAAIAASGIAADAAIVTGETSTGLATVGGETGAEVITAETGLQTAVSPLAQFESIPSLASTLPEETLTDEFIPTEEGLGVQSAPDEFVPNAEGFGVEAPPASDVVRSVADALDTAKKIIGVAGAAKSVLAGKPNNTAANGGQRSDVAPLAGTWTQPGTRLQQVLPSSASPSWFIAAAIGGFVLLLVLLLRR